MEYIPRERTCDGEVGLRRNVARGALLGIAGQAWHLVTAFLLYAFLARRLGPATFGQWRVVLSVLVWFEIVVNAGMVKVVTKAITEASEKRASAERASYAGQMLLAAGAFALVEVLAGPIAALLSDPSLAPYLRIAALDIPLYALFLVASAVVLGEQRFERQAVSWIVYATAKFVAIAVLVAVGFSVQGALIGNALSSVVGFAAVFTPWRRGDATRREIGQLTRWMLAASVPFLTVSLLEGLVQSTDLWFVSAIVGNGLLVGLYASASVLAEIPMFLMTGLNRVLFPSVARAGAEGDARLAGHYAVQGVRTAIIVTVFGVAVAAATGRLALELVYSSVYAGAFVPLVILVFAAVGRTVRAACAEVLMATNRGRLAVASLAGAFVLEVALLAVLAPRYGLVGAAAGGAAAALAAGGAAAFLIRASLGVRPLLTLGRCTVAAAFVGVALAYLTPNAPIALFVAFPLAAVLYLALLRLLREIDADDVASIRMAMER